VKKDSEEVCNGLVISSLMGNDGEDELYVLGDCIVLLFHCWSFVFGEWMDRSVAFVAKPCPSMSCPSPQIHLPQYIHIV
jgi:hypothetical protein